MNETAVYVAAGWESIQDSPVWLATLVMLGLLMLATSLWAGWRERRLAPRGWIALALLRAVAVAAIVIVIAGVERRSLTERQEPSQVVVLIDQSASMSLTAQAQPQKKQSRAEQAEELTRSLSEELADRHTVRTARFDSSVWYEQRDASSSGTTRLGAALRRVLSDFSATPLASVVVLSDGGWNAGPPPDEAIQAANNRAIPIHTLGVGPLHRPTNPRVRDLVAPSRASVGDPFQATVTVSSAPQGDPPALVLKLQRLNEEAQLGEVALEVTPPLDPDGTGGWVTAVENLQARSPGSYQLSASIIPGGADADPTDNTLTTIVELVDEPTRILLAAGGPSRDYRFLRDQLFRDDQFECDVMLQSVLGVVTQDAGQVRSALPIDSGEWESYDVLVAIDLDWRSVKQSSVDSLSQWIATRGGGLIVAAAGVATPRCVREGLEPALAKLLPVTLRDDPLALVTALNRRPNAIPVSLTSLGEHSSFLSPPNDRSSMVDAWDRLPGFYGQALPAEPKPAARVLAKLGETPLIAEHAYGAGRVAYLASAETWRLRRYDPRWFESLHTGLLRFVSQGRLLDADAEGALLFDRAQYTLGDTMSLRYIRRGLETDQTPPTIAARIQIAGEAPFEVDLAASEGQPGVYLASISAHQVGDYRATSTLPSGARLTAQAEVSLPSIESETVVQNASLLRQVATETGGQYVDLSSTGTLTEALQLAATIEPVPETNYELGPPDPAFAQRLASVALAILAGALLLEYLLRRSWRLA